MILSKCLFLTDFAGSKGGKIEDLFPEDYYLEAVKEAYPTIKMPIKFNDEEKKIKNVSKKVKVAFDRMKYINFERNRPAKIIFDWIHEKHDNNGKALTRNIDESNNGNISKIEDVLKKVDNIENYNDLRKDAISIKKSLNNKNNGRKIPRYNQRYCISKG